MPIFRLPLYVKRMTNIEVDEIQLGPGLFHECLGG
jgi:hypothetical protein